MEASERDNTQDWLVEKEVAPPLLGELVERIDEALEVAYASEAAVETVEAAVETVAETAVEAAEQARDAVEQANRAAEQAYRSAELAERASSSMLEDRRRRTVAEEPATVPEDGDLRSFSERADRVVARLRALEQLPA